MESLNRVLLHASSILGFALVVLGVGAGFLGSYENHIEIDEDAFAISYPLNIPSTYDWIYDILGPKAWSSVRGYALDVSATALASEQEIFVGLLQQTPGSHSYPTFPYLSLLDSLEVGSVLKRQMYVQTYDTDAATPVPRPDSLSVWDQYSQGSGRQTLELETTQGLTEFVVMNADSSAGIHIRLEHKHSIPFYEGVGFALVTAGLVAAVLGLRGLAP